MLFDDKAGLPTLCRNGFHAPPPALPVLVPESSADSSTTTASASSSLTKRLLCPSFATATVQSLYAGDVGHAGKLQYLRAQFLEHGLLFMGIQEARSEAMCSQVDGVLRLASGAQKGQGGIELWLNTACPFAYVQNKLLFLQKRDLTIIFSSPRCLFVRVVHAAFRALIVVAHCPQSGWSLQSRQDWWEQFSDRVSRQHLTASEQLYVLFDANAATGSTNLPFIGPLADRESANTIFLRDFLRQHELCLPATFHIHQGSHSTWHSPDGQHECRIDYVAIPSTQLDACVHSAVLTDFDMGTVHVDHHAAAVQLQWSDWGAQRNLVSAPYRQSFKFDRDSLQPQGLSHMLNTVVVPDWSCDIETHVDHYNKDVLQILCTQHPVRAAMWKKPFFDDALWQLPRDKLATSHSLRALHRRLRLENLFRVWRTWTGTPTPSHSTAAVQYEVTLKCTAVRLAARHHQTACQLRSRLKTKKFAFLAERLGQLPPEASASAVLRAVKKVYGPTNPKKLKLGTLPSIKQDDGSVCPTPQAVIDRWVQFFGAMEGGQRVSHDELRQLWRQNLARFQQ
eukprot:s2841_g6.t1